MIFRIKKIVLAVRVAHQMKALSYPQRFCLMNVRMIYKINVLIVLSLYIKKCKTWLLTLTKYLFLME